MGIILLLVLLMGLGVTIQMRASLRSSLGQQLEQQGISIAWDVAARSTDYIFTNNLYSLHELLKDTMVNNENVRYVFILDPGGEVLVHTFRRGLPKGLREANLVSGNDRYSKKTLETNEGSIHDIAVPIFEGKAGLVRVGISEDSIQKAIKETTETLIVNTTVVSLIGAFAAFALTALLTAPIEEMVQGTKEVSAGNLNRRVKVWWARDEIGQLALAFNNMIESLKKSQIDIENFSAQIIKRNKELAAYNAIALTVGQSLDLEMILNAVMDHISDLMQISYGEIYVLDREREKFILMVTKGNSEQIIGSKEINLDEGIGGEAFNKGEHELTGTGEFGRAYCSKVSLPLKAKTTVVGLMNLYWQEDLIQTTEYIQLLTTLNSQIGVAIENAILWQELKNKEALRTMLLEKVITAQEEERKRIARELHDQTSQSLASLMMGLEMLENTDSILGIKERVEDLRFIANSVLGELHDIALELRPSILDDLGLEAALQQYIKDWSNKFRVNGDLHCYGILNYRFPAQVELTVYRVVQEALTNIAKYAQANSVSIIVERKKSVLTAIVEDNGIGFELQHVLASPLKEKKLGIFGMKERVSVIGGEFTIESEPGVGTTIYAKIPLERVVSHG
jgi:signal transduction histidine kinase